MPWNRCTAMLPSRGLRPSWASAHPERGPRGWRLGPVSGVQ
jgi:hypothetical protein